MEASTLLFNRWLSIDPAKSALLIGPRRCGKTTLLRQRFPEHRYATLDDLDFLDWAVRDPKGFVSHLGPRCIIDEIQRSPKLTIAVKYAIDNEGAHVLMTGSSSLGLLDAAADSLAGRVRLYEMTPACWGEDRGAPTHGIFGALPDPPALKAAARELDEVLACGLFPEVLTTEGREARLALLNDYRNTYFMKDLLQMANLDNLEGLMAIYVNACRSLGSHIEVSHFAREAGLSFPTAKKYLNMLVQSQLAFRLTGYHFGPAKRIIKAAKTYFADNGIPASFRVPLSEGQILENFVISELEKRRRMGRIRADQLFYYKTAAGREIDVVFEADGVVHAIEIKCTRAPGRADCAALRDFAAALELAGRPVRCVLFHRGEDTSTLDGVRLLPVASLMGAG
ncbi:ATP-binding protein [Myxococcota bacterium]|nr:ATP-binding protein [Myxococcota bacterium]